MDLLRNVIYEAYYAQLDDEAIPLMRENSQPIFDAQNHDGFSRLECDARSQWRCWKWLPSLCRTKSTNSDCEGWQVFWLQWGVQPWPAYDTIGRFLIHISLTAFLVYTTYKVARIREDIYDESTKEAFYFGNNVRE